jgi:hypothetical protein
LDKLRQNILKHKWIYIITSISFFLKVYWIYKVNNDPYSDFLSYYNLAIAVANGDNPVRLGYQGAGYPLFLALVFFITKSTSFLLVKWVNVVLSTLTLVFIYFTLNKLIKNNYVKIITLFVVAMLPNYISYTNVISTEILGTFFLSIIIALYVSNVGFYKKSILLGIIIGAATLVKPYFIVLPIIILFVSIFSNFTFKEAIKAFLVIYVSFFIAVTPWIIRNVLLYDTLMVASYNGGVVLYINNNDENTNGKYMVAGDVIPSDELLKKFEEKGLTYGEANSVEANDLYKEAAVEWIINNPKKFAVLGVKRVKNTFFAGSWDISAWTFSQYDNKGDTFDKLVNKIVELNGKFIKFISFISLIASVSYLAYRILAWKNKNSDKISLILSTLVLFYFMVHFVFEGQPRYSFPVLFVFIMVNGKILDVILNKYLIGKKNAIEN